MNQESNSQNQDVERDRLRSREQEVEIGKLEVRKLELQIELLKTKDRVQKGLRTLFGVSALLGIVLAGLIVVYGRTVPAS